MKHHITLGVLLVCLLSCFSIQPAYGITLDTCIQTALDKNPDVLAAMHRISASSAMITQARSAWLPRLSVSGTYAVTDNPPEAFMMTLNQRQLNMMDPGFDPNNPDDTDNYRLSAGLQYRLFDGGKRKKSVDMSRLGKEAASLQLRSVQNELIHQVTKGYYGLLQAQAFVAVQEESVKSLEESFRVAKERFRAGSAVKTDVLNLEVRLAQAREDLIRAENMVRLAAAGLNTAIGDDLIPPEGMDRKEETAEISDLPSLDLQAIQNRPEYRAANKMADIKEKAYKKAVGEYFPTVNLFGSYDWDSEDFSDIQDSYKAGVMVQWMMFTGFQRHAGVRQANEEWLAAKQEMQKAANQLRLDLKQAHIQASEARERMAVTQKSVVSAEEALRITQEQYTRGATDITMLLTAQVGLTAQKTRNVAARYDYLTALSNLERARGELTAKYAQE